MFRHILIPTDGSAAAARAAQAAVQLAAETGARVTALTAEEPSRPHLHSHGFSTEKVLVAELDRRSRTAAEEIANQVAEAARAAGVPVEVTVVESAEPCEAILQAAKERGCDVIAMGSRGHKGLSGLLLGSVTHQVLARSTVPVLVYR